MTDTVSSIDDWVDSMATALDADVYLEDRGYTDWVDESDDDLKNQALLRAWDYLSGLDWLDGVFDDELPDKVKHAQILAAYHEYKTPYCLQPELTQENYIASKNIAGAIIKSYRVNAPAKSRFLAIESLLRPYLRSSGLNVSLNRG